MPCWSLRLFVYRIEYDYNAGIENMWLCWFSVRGRRVQGFPGGLFTYSTALRCYRKGDWLIKSGSDTFDCSGNDTMCNQMYMISIALRDWHAFNGQLIDFTLRTKLSHNSAGVRMEPHRNGTVWPQTDSFERLTAEFHSSHRLWSPNWAMGGCLRTGKQQKIRKRKDLKLAFQYCCGGMGTLPYDSGGKSVF